MPYRPSQQSNTCPQCKQRFKRITKVWYEDGVRKVKKYRVKKKDQEEPTLPGSGGDLGGLRGLLFLGHDFVQRGLGSISGSPPSSSGGGLGLGRRG